LSIPQNALNIKDPRPLVVDELNIRSQYICSLIDQYRPSAKSPIEFVIAGGCMIDDITDIDIFPVDDFPMLHITGSRDGKIVSETRNATTWTGYRYPLQLCNYRKKTLAELVNSFDFTHIQVGARIRIAPSLIEDALPAYSVEEVYYTENWISARCFRKSQYTGSNYPLSSLIRMHKYLKKGYLQEKDRLPTTLKILNDVVKRGFTSYDDFKDQLDAVDLGLLPEDFKDLEKDELKELYEHLLKPTLGGTK
jgi:hypothetical protein